MVFRVLSISLLLLAGTLALAQQPEIGTPATQAVPQPPAASGAAEPAGTVSPNYIIGPGDTIQVFVWRNPELTVSVPVRPDGKVSTPLVEDMVAVGKTPSQLARDIEQRLAEFVREPTVNIIVSNPVSAFSQVKVVGQVKAPQSLAYREGMTVLDAVLNVGGLTDFAAANRVKVVRREGSASRELPVRLGTVLLKGNMKENILLKPGDVIIVPESWF